MSWPQNWVQQPSIVPAIVPAPVVTATTSLAYGTMTPEQYTQQQNW